MDSKVKKNVKKRVVKKVKRKIRRRMLKKILLITLSVGLVCLVLFSVKHRRKLIGMIAGLELKKALVRLKMPQKQLNRFAKIVKNRKTKADLMSVNRHF